MERPSKIKYYLNIAKSVSDRSTCLRRRYGAIIVKNDRIISTGYNGAPRGKENCCDIGKCWRKENNIPSGSMYEACLSSHAEMNAIIQGAPDEMESADLYLWGCEADGTPISARPCKICQRLLLNAGINKIYAIDDTKTGFVVLNASDYYDRERRISKVQFGEKI